MSRLGEYLKSQGFVVDDNPVPGRTSTWRGVSWIFVHHYAANEDPADSARQANYLRRGGLYPPNAQLFVDITGKVWVISEERAGQPVPGRATHAGAGSYPGIPTDGGNEVSLGIEVQNTGYHPLSDNAVSYNVLIRLVAALRRLYGLPNERVIGHKEYAGSAQGKVDPRDSMDKIRADVASVYSNPGTPVTIAPTPPPPVGDDMYLAQTPDGTIYLISAGGATPLGSMDTVKAFLGLPNFPPVKALTSAQVSAIDGALRASAVERTAARTLAYLNDPAKATLLAAIQAAVTELDVAGVDLDALAEKVAAKLSALQFVPQPGLIAT